MEQMQCGFLSALKFLHEVELLFRITVALNRTEADYIYAEPGSQATNYLRQRLIFLVGLRYCCN